MSTTSSRPRICFVVTYFPKYFPAGAEIQTYFIARHMLSKGWSVHFTTEDCGQPTAKLQNEDGIWVHKVRRTRLFNPLKCWRLYRRLLRINADIYYQRGGSEHTFVAALAASRPGKRFVWSTSSSLDCEGNKFRWSVADEKVRGVKRLILWLDAWVRDALISRGRKKAEVVVVQSSGQMARVKHKLGLESMVIKSGHAVPQPTIKKESPPLVVWIANMKTLKRAELFIELAKRCSDLPARFLLVGECADPSYRRQLRELGRGVRNLQFAGSVSFDRSNELLSAASVLVNTSTREGFPNTFVQAWLRETPVVSLVVDPDGILQRQKIGIPSGNFARMLKDVRRLLTDESFRNEMGKRARAYAAREHDLSDKLKQYADLFESLYYESRMV